MPVNRIVQAVLFFCLIFTASIWDARKRVIPDSICIMVFLTGLLTFVPGKLFGILLGLPFLIAALAKEGGMGGGDIKLTTACGFVLGLPVGCVGLVIGMLTVLTWHILVTGACKIMHMPTPAVDESSLPLAPFLSVGFAIANIFLIL